MPIAPRIARLLYNLLNEVLTPEESAELECWIEEDPDAVKRYKDPDTLWKDIESILEMDDESFRGNKDHRPIEAEHPRKRKVYFLKRRSLKVKLLFAASIVTAILVAGYPVSFNPSNIFCKRKVIADRMEWTHKLAQAARTQEVKAVIILDDDKRIYPTDIPIGGTIALDGCIIERDGEHSIVYHALSGNSKPAEIHHAFLVPKCESWKVKLSDGSKAQIYACSVLSYPVDVPASSQVSVQLEGRGFFEVIRNVYRPFIVQTAGYMVDALGTSFDVRHYRSDDSIWVTLVQGSVRVHYFNASTLLHPGQEARINPMEKSKCRIRKVNTRATLSWIKGYFDFNGKDMGDILQEIVDWYGLDSYVVEGKINEVDPLSLGSGMIGRGIPLDELLENLGSQSIQYRVEGKKIILHVGN